MGRTKIVGDEEVLEAARRVFIRDGHAATTRDVAREAGISQAVLYQRFKTKDDLFFAAMAPPQPDLSFMLGSLADAEYEGAEEHLGAIAHRLHQHLAIAAPSLLHLATHPSFGLSAIGRAHDRIGSDTLGRALTERIRTFQAMEMIGPDVNAEALASALIAAVHGLALHEVVAGGAAPGGGELGGMVAAICRGVRP